MALSSIFDNFAELHVCRQTEENMIMRGDGLGQISLRLFTVSNTKMNLSVTTVFSVCLQEG